MDDSQSVIISKKKRGTVWHHQSKLEQGVNVYRYLRVYVQESGYQTVMKSNELTLKAADSTVLQLCF